MKPRPLPAVEICGGASLRSPAKRPNEIGGALLRSPAQMRKGTQRSMQLNRKRTFYIKEIKLRFYHVRLPALVTLRRPHIYPEQSIHILPIPL